MRALFGALILMTLLTGLSCSKVPIHNVRAGFTLADASWFAEEETLFIFYEASAEQGLGDPTVIEITYATDEERVDWVPLSQLDPVHTHVGIDCGLTALCGSASVHVPLEPRDVDIRLRYHRDGDLALNTDTVFNVIGTGEAHSNRSLIIYGVFDESNQRIQWRSRHQFPTLRNHRAEELGLRRDFTIQDQDFGQVDEPEGDNPYGYGIPCPSTFDASGLEVVETNERAAFNREDLPLAASDASGVCAQSTVIDALGEFTTSALARKNPEVRPAFPVLRSPVHEATPIQFFLGPCDRVISEPHETMQRQRLLLGGLPTYCIDDWDSPGFVDTLVVAFRDAVETERAAGDDMVLVVALHQNESGVSEAVEEALAQVVPGERHRNSPRLAGAFVFDSTSRGLSLSQLSPVTLWCPSTGMEDDVSGQSCATAPDIPDLELGPFSFNTLQILPTRAQYLDFISTYSEAQAGEVTSLSFLAPEFAASSEHIDLGQFGVVTFLNDETIDADADDAFSYCIPEESPFFVVRSPFMQDPEFATALRQACAVGAVPPTLCGVPELGMLGIEWLPIWHNVFAESDYEVGLFWEFPFLLRMNYETMFAGSVSAFGLSVPFGLANPEESYYGTDVWLSDEYPLDPALTQCRRFCDHPTFDSAGVYQVTDPFRSTYVHACYLPAYPALGDSGFPLDP